MSPALTVSRAVDTVGLTNRSSADQPGVTSRWGWLWTTTSEEGT
jgi:hypothetical protein